MNLYRLVSGVMHLLAYHSMVTEVIGPVQSIQKKNTEIKAIMLFKTKKEITKNHNL